VALKSKQWASFPSQYPSKSLPPDFYIEVTIKCSLTLQ
jgi:hypothetical protein